MGSFFEVAKLWRVQLAAWYQLGCNELTSPSCKLDQPKVFGDIKEDTLLHPSETPLGHTLAGALPGLHGQHTHLPCLYLPCFALVCPKI